MGKDIHPVSSVILAGGKSRRMGLNKAFLKIGEQAIIERVTKKMSVVGQEVILVTNSPDEYAHLGRQMVSDVYPGKGSLGGIYSGLRAASNHYALVVACDMPFLNTSLLRYMILLSTEHDVVVPNTQKGLEPLHAIYSKNCLPAMESLLQENNLKITSFYPQVRARYVEQAELEILDPQLLSFFNINSPNDLEWARRMAVKVNSFHRRK